MNLRLLLQSVVFVVEGLLLVLVFSAVLHFEIARLLFAIAIAVLCLIAEVFVVVKAARHLWKWSGRLADVIVRCVSVKVIRTATAAGNRGEA
ncbi:MAG: hypothetical protein WBE76_24980 [Terracidiphilus sp.]